MCVYDVTNYVRIFYMNTYDTLFNDMKSAMKEKNSKKVLLIRGLISSIKNATINAGKEITDEVVLTCIKKNIKELDQSIESFTKANRADDVASLNNDRSYLQQFLPKQLDEAELEAIVKASINELGVTSKKDMGKVMKDVMSKTKGRADGKVVSAIVSKMLV